MGRVLAVIASALLVAAAGSAQGSQLRASSLTLTGLWTTATPPGAPTAAGYLAITNNGAAADRLLAVTSPLAAGAMLHDMELVDGVASMRMVDGIDIPPGKTVTLGPNAFHIMFVTMTQ